MKTLIYVQNDKVGSVFSWIAPIFNHSIDTAGH